MQVTFLIINNADSIVEYESNFARIPSTILFSLLAYFSVQSINAAVKMLKVRSCLVQSLFTTFQSPGFVSSNSSLEILFQISWKNWSPNCGFLFRLFDLFRLFYLLLLFHRGSVESTFKIVCFVKSDRWNNRKFPKICTMKSYKKYITLKVF